MIVSSHGIIGSSIGQFDADAAAFFARVTAAGGTLTTTEQTATNSLVVQMKADGIWNSMKAIYPMVGASAAACAQNLKSSSFTGTFTATGWTFASTGVTPNGSSAYFDTNFNPSTNLTISSSHQAQYQRNNASNSGFAGVWDGGGPTLRLEFATNSNPFGVLCDIASNGARDTFPTTANTNGNIVASSLFPNFKLFRNSTQIGSISTGTDVFPNRNYYFSALNNNGIAAFFSNMPISLASLGDGLTDTQVFNYSTAVQAFQTTLLREV